MVYSLIGQHADHGRIHHQLLAEMPEPAKKVMRIILDEPFETV